MCTRPRRRRRRRRGACTQDAGAERGGRAAQRELMMVREQGKPSQTIARCRPWTPWNRFLDLPGRLEPFVDAASLSVFAPGVCRARSYQPRAARGRPADRVRERFGDFTLLECELLTGRTHQARPLRPLSPCVWKPFEPLCVETGSRCENGSRVRRGGTGASGSEGPRAAAAACAEGAEPQIRVHLAHVGHPLAGDEKVTAPTALRVQRLQPPATPPPRTKWTRRVPHPVLIGHAAGTYTACQSMRQCTPDHCTIEMVHLTIDIPVGPRGLASERCTIHSTREFVASPARAARTSRRRYTVSQCTPCPLAPLISAPNPLK